MIAAPPAAAAGDPFAGIFWIAAAGAVAGLLCLMLVEDKPLRGRAG